METRIRIMLLEAGLSVAEAAFKAGMTRQWFTAVIQNRWQSANARRKIAAALGRPYSEVWGEPDPQAKAA